MALSEGVAAVDDDPLDVDFNYRPLSVGAVVSVVFGLLSGLVFLAGQNSLQDCLMMCPIPVVGIVLGFHTWRKIGSMPDVLGGYRLAVTGTLLSLFGLVAGLGYSGYVYSTEVHAGYTRISFGKLRPDEIDLRGGHMVPSDILQLDNQPIFIKGYMREGTSSQRHNVRRFLLVRDNKLCCFGDLSKVKYYDQILVTVPDTLRVDYSTGIFRTEGTLHVDPKNVHNGPEHPVFTLDADDVR